MNAGMTPHDKRLMRKTGIWPPLVENTPSFIPDREAGEDTGIIQGRYEVIRELVFAVENATEGIALIDQKGLVRYHNQAHARLFGYHSPHELNGHSWKKGFIPPEAERIEAECNAAFLHKPFWQGQTRALRQNGEQFQASVTISVLPNGDMLCLSRDMSTLERAQKEKAGLFEIIANPILVLDEGGIIHETNSAWTELLGFGAEETLGSPFQGFALPEDAPLAAEQLAQARESGRSKSFTCRNPGKSGQILWFEWTFFRLDRQRLLAYGHNNTAMMEAQTAAIEAAIARMHLANQRSHFFTMASHELRTPVSTIGLGLGLLARHGSKLSTGEFQDTVEKLQEQTQRLASIFEKMLTIGESFSGKLVPEPRPLSLCVLAETLLREETARYGRQGDAVFKSNAGPAHFWNLDRELVRQILANLLSNACKYSQPGTPIGLEITGESSRVRIAVKDRGIGIPAEDLDRVTGGFFRSKNTGDIPGVGLGLLLVRQCAGAQGGNCEIASEPGCGTTVTVTLPATWVEIHPGDTHS